MKRIIFEKLTIKEKKKVLAGVINPVEPPNSRDSNDPSDMNGDACSLYPLNPDSECAQGGG
jgi:hypothetical protein